MTTKRALIVGINDYKNVPSLNGCVNDAKNISKLIEKNDDGSRNFDIKLINFKITKEITKSILKEHLSNLLTKPADIALFYFSGHGTATNLGGYLCTHESNVYDEGYPMQDLLTLINKAPINEVVVILDCCQSGSLGQIPTLNTNGISFLKEGTSILTASRDNESAIEYEGSGIFTSLVCDALSGSAADLLGIVTPAGVYAHVEQSFGAWDQRPLFKSYVSRSTPLRKTTPKIDITDLRNLPLLFTKKDEHHNLDPSYEYTEAVSTEENIVKFKLLKKFQTASLIKVNRENEPDLYWACLESLSCQLTPLGQFYWHLVETGKI